MKNLFIKKFLISLLIGIIFILLTCTRYSNATITENEQSNKEGNEITVNDVLETSSKIMKYDANTNETTEVNMQEIENILKIKNDKTSYTTSYRPNNPIISHLTTPYILNDNGSMERINDTSIYPYSVTCRISSNNSSGILVVGTGTLVGPKILITAAHCVYDENNEKLKYWTAYAGYNDGNYWGSSGYFQVYYSSDWINNRTDGEDWAVVVLNEDLGNQIGWNGVQSYGDDSYLLNQSVWTIGYPTDIDYGFDRKGLYQYKTFGTIEKVYNNYFDYSGTTVYGFSGGPVMRMEDDYIVGVHYGIIKGKVSATRITTQIVNLIKTLQSTYPN